ncbi:synaptobrevin, longin-like domain protein [Tanacetum coccineum]
MAFMWFESPRLPDLSFCEFDMGEGYAFPKKAYFVCGSLSHLIKDYDFHEKRMAQEQAMAKQNEKTNGMGNFNRKWDKMTNWENTQRVDPSNKIVPRAVLLQFGIVDLSSTRPNLSTPVPTGRQNLSKPVTTGRRNLPTLVPTGKAVPAGRPNYPIPGNPHKLTEDLGIVDSGCSRSMTGNRHRLENFQEFKGGNVTFGGGEGKITGKDFKLPDETQVLLKVPRKHNLYSFNLEDLAPQGDLACLLAKATLDESTQWHRRLGHVNFKNINKLVKAIVATIDGAQYTISEASVRSNLQLADEGGLSNLPDPEIYAGLTHICYQTEGHLTFWKNRFSPQWRFLVHTIIHCISSKSGGWDQFSSAIATALICLSSGRVYNFSRLIFEGMVNNLSSKKKFLMYPSFLQIFLGIQTVNTTQYPAHKMTKKVFANMKMRFVGAHMPLLPAMLAGAAEDQGERPAEPADQPPISAPIPSPILSPVNVPNPPIIAPITTSPPRKCTNIPPSNNDQPSSSRLNEPDEEPLTSTFVEDETAGGSFHESLPRSNEATPSAGQPSGVAYDPLTLYALSSIVSKFMQKTTSLESELKDTKKTLGTALITLVGRVKKLEVEKEIDMDSLLALENASLAEQQSSFVTPSKDNDSGESQEQDISSSTVLL